MQQYIDLLSRPPKQNDKIQNIANQKINHSLTNYNQSLYQDNFINSQKYSLISINKSNNSQNYTKTNTIKYQQLSSQEQNNKCHFNNQMDMYFNPNHVNNIPTKNKKFVSKIPPNIPTKPKQKSKFKTNQFYISCEYKKPKPIPKKVNKLFDIYQIPPKTILALTHIITTKALPKHSIFQNRSSAQISQTKKINYFPTKNNPSSSIKKLVNRYLTRTKQKLNKQSQIFIFNTMHKIKNGVQINNPHKINQDQLIYKQHYQLQQNHVINLYAIADGHGTNGHLLSNFITKNLFSAFQKCYKQTSSIASSLPKTYKYLQSVLQNNTYFNSNYSGSTLITLLIQNNRYITCANVGNSRAIIAKQLYQKHWEVKQLSNDHKPTKKQQKNRIVSKGGRIQTAYDQHGLSLGPQRVWLPTKQTSGLVTTRSLGDNISKNIGVIYQPQIITHQLTSNDKFILIASDAIWKYLTNDKIIHLIIPYYHKNKLQSACSVLLKSVYNSWILNNSQCIDDITFILIFIKMSKSNNSIVQYQYLVKKNYNNYNKYQQNLQNYNPQKQSLNVDHIVQQKIYQKNLSLYRQNH